MPEDGRSSGDQKVADKLVLYVNPIFYYLALLRHLVILGLNKRINAQLQPNRIHYKRVPSQLRKYLTVMHAPPTYH